MPETPNHGYNVPNEGEQDWHRPLNENFRQYDTDIEVRDTDANRGNYDPKAGAKFLATDTGIVYEGDGSEWVPRFGLWRYTVPAPDLTGNLIAGHPANGVGTNLSGAVIAGGGSENFPNRVESDQGTIGGGAGNTGAGFGSTVAGGYRNTARAGDAPTVGGGEQNTAEGNYTTVNGGKENTATAEYATVGGGERNTASGSHTSLSGGESNSAEGRFSSVSGGSGNTAGGDFSTVAGGFLNEAGESYGFAAGRSAESLAKGAFVWGDGSDETVQSQTANEVVFQAGGGVTLWSSSDFSSGAQLKSGSGSWSSLSTRAAKANVESVDPAEALEGVAAMDIATWNYESQDETVRHMGPMAEEFHDAFGLGADRERIANVDADGVAFAAIQGLAEELAAKEERIAELEETVAEQEAREERIAELEETVAEQAEAIEDLREELSPVEAEAD